MERYATPCSIDPRLAGTGAPFGAAADRHVSCLAGTGVVGASLVGDRRGAGPGLWSDIGAGAGTGGHTP